MNTSEIVVRERVRKDMGDLKALSESIQAVGLLHPVVVNARNKLVAGERRLRACELLGWTDIPVTVAANLDDAVKAQQAEEEENTCRKDLLPSEAVRRAKRYEPLEVEAAKERQGTRTDLEPSGKFPGSSQGETRDKLGTLVGMSGKTLQKAREVVEAAEESQDAHGTNTDRPYRPNVGVVGDGTQEGDERCVMEKGRG